MEWDVEEKEWASRRRGFAHQFDSRVNLDEQSPYAFMGIYGNKIQIQIIQSILTRFLTQIQGYALNCMWKEIKCP